MTDIYRPLYLAASKSSVVCFEVPMGHLYWTKKIDITHETFSDYNVIMLDTIKRLKFNELIIYFKKLGKED